MSFGSLLTALCIKDSFHAQFHTHRTGQTFQLVLYQPVRYGGEGRNRAPLVADNKVIMPHFIGDSSGLCHYLNFRFLLGLLAILLAISNRLFFYFKLT
jgi:hypothetical protein